MTESAPPPRPDGLPYMGLAIIAKDEEESIGRLLDSFGWTEFPEEGERPEWDEDDGLIRLDAAVDVVVVCDTGSKDRTKEIAQERGCKVIDFEWVGDFSKARQASWDALPEWCWFGTWADCDDVVEGAEKLRLLAAQMPPEAAGMLFPYEYAHDEAGNVSCYLERERIVRHGIGEKWKLPVHEILDTGGGAIVRSQEVKWVHHRAEENGERNYKILLADYRRSKQAGEQPDPRTIAYLGSEALVHGKLKPSEKYLREYLRVGTFDEELCQVAHKLSLNMRAQMDATHKPAEKAKFLEKMEEAAFLAIKHRPDWADGYLDLSAVASIRQDWAGMLRWAEIAAEKGVPQTFLIVSPLEYEFEPLLMRAIAYTHMGELGKATELTQQALAKQPFRDDIRNQLGGLMARTKMEETKKHVLALRELLCRHDENLKADELMKLVPYYVQDDPEIAQARLDQREMVLHATDPETYSRYYGANPNEAPFETHGMTVEEAHAHFPRLAFLRDGLAEQSKGKGKKKMRVLDLSGNDGWMAANLALAGYTCDMLELNKDAAKRAGQRKNVYPKMGEVVHDNLFSAPEHFEAGSYDAVVCFETIEHVPDPKALMELAAKMCKKSGRVYISTPNGAYEMGNVPAWHVVEHKGHLRAIRPDDLCGWACELGATEQFMLGADRVQVVSFRPVKRKGKVIFYAGPVNAAPEKILEGGQGGSETALCKMAELFARKGYDVRVFAGAQGIGLRGDQVTIEGKDRLKGQVLYQGCGDWNPGEECDLFVSSRRPEVFDRSINAKRTALWLHDAEYGDMLTEERAARADVVFVMSEFQRELLRETYPFLKKHKGLTVTRNGIEARYFEEEPTRKKPWVVYSSSPDRGLDILLECWPDVLKQVPEAELHHTYAPIYQAFANVYPHLRAHADRIDDLAEATTNVVAHEGLGQRQLAELFLQARVWAYPSWNTPGDIAFPEISCISAMEAQAAGCVPVFNDYAALNETVTCGIGVEMPVGPNGPLIDWAWRERFVAGIVRGLKSRSLRAECKEQGRAWGLGLAWDEVADEWEEKLLKGSPKRVSRPGGAGILLHSGAD